ncbi:MAG: hypothetical protein NTV80_11375 [Verrucomicrobia bacterium]|nr:hypothetical protein [Verrucomicrobiota bacterium]
MSQPKNVYALAFFGLLALMVVAGGGFFFSQRSAPKSEAVAIQKVLDQYQICHEVIKSQKEAKVPGGKIFKETAENLRRIDVSDCPSDFCEAHVRLVGSIENTGLLLASYPDTFSIVKDMGLKLLGGNWHAGYSKIKDRADQVIQDVTTCHTEVDALAARYGARLVEW